MSERLNLLSACNLIQKRDALIKQLNEQQYKCERHEQYQMGMKQNKINKYSDNIKRYQNDLGRDGITDNQKISIQYKIDIEQHKLEGLREAPRPLYCVGRDARISIIQDELQTIDNILTSRMTS